LANLHDFRQEFGDITFLQELVLRDIVDDLPVLLKLGFMAAGDLCEILISVVFLRFFEVRLVFILGLRVDYFFDFIVQIFNEC